MKKIFILAVTTLLLVSGCGFSTTVFSESRKNFDEKLDRIEAFLKAQDCSLTESIVEGQEQYIITHNTKYESFSGGSNQQVIENKVILTGNIMANNTNKGKMYFVMHVALITDKDTDVHLNMRNKKITDLTFTYDGKKVVLVTKQDYGTYLYGRTQFIYSDIKIMKEIAEAKEIKMEGRNAIGRKFTQTLSNDDLALFKKMLYVIEEVHNILNDK